MAGNRKFHNKFHSANHHTIPSPHIIDSGLDPIASHDFPFIGDFVLNGMLSASNNLLVNNGNRHSSKLDTIDHGLHPVIDLGLTGNWNILRDSTYIDGDTLITGNLSALGEVSYFATQVHTTSATEIEILADNSNGKTAAFTVDQHGTNDLFDIRNDRYSVLMVTGSGDGIQTHPVSGTPIGGHIGINLGNLSDIDRPNQRMTIVGSVSVVPDPLETMNQNQQKDPGVTGSIYVEGGLHVNDHAYLDQLTVDTTDGKFLISGGNNNSTSNIMDVMVPSEFDMVTIDTTDGDFLIKGTNKVQIDTKNTQGVSLDVKWHTRLDQLTVDTSLGEMYVSGSAGIDIDTHVDIDEHTHLDQVTIDTTDGKLYIHGGNNDTNANPVDIDVPTLLDKLTVDTTDGVMTVSGSNKVYISAVNSNNVGFDVDTHTTLDQVTIDTDDGAMLVTGGNMVYVDTKLDKVATDVGFEVKSWSKLNKTTIDTTLGRMYVSGGNNDHTANPLIVTVPTELDKTTINTDEGVFLIEGDNETKLTNKNTSGVSLDVQWHTRLDQLTVDTNMGVMLVSGSGGVDIDTDVDIDGHTRLDQLTVDTTDGVMSVVGTRKVSFTNTQGVDIDTHTTLDQVTVDTNDGVFLIKSTGTNNALDVDVPTLLDKVTVDTDDGVFRVTGDNRLYIDSLDQVRGYGLEVDTHALLNQLTVHTNDGGMLVSGSERVTIKATDEDGVGLYVDTKTMLDETVISTNDGDFAVHGNNKVLITSEDTDTGIGLEVRSHAYLNKVTIDTSANEFKIIGDGGINIDGHTQLDRVTVVTDDGEFLIRGENKLNVQSPAEFITSTTTLRKTIIDTRVNQNLDITGSGVMNVDVSDVNFDGHVYLDRVTVDVDDGDFLIESSQSWENKNKLDVRVPTTLASLTASTSNSKAVIQGALPIEFKAPADFYGSANFLDPDVNFVDISVSRFSDLNKVHINTTVGDFEVSGSGTTKIYTPVLIDDDVYITGDLRVDGNTYLSAGTDGVINVGDKDGDNVIFYADVKSNILPNTTDSFDLGLINKRWLNVFAASGRYDQLDVENHVDIDGTLDVDGHTKLDQLTVHTNDGRMSISGSNQLYIKTDSGIDIDTYVDIDGYTRLDQVTIDTDDGRLLIEGENEMYIRVQNGIDIDTYVDIDEHTRLDQVTIDTNDGAMHVSGSNELYIKTVDGVDIDTTVDIDEHTQLDQVTVDTTDGKFLISGGSNDSAAPILDVHVPTELDMLTVDTTDGRFLVSGTGDPGYENPVDVDVPIHLDRTYIDTTDGSFIVSGENRVYVNADLGFWVDTHTQLDQLTVDTTDDDMLVKGTNKLIINTAQGLDVDTHTQLDQLTVHTTDGSMVISGENRTHIHTGLTTYSDISAVGGPWVFDCAKNPVAEPGSVNPVDQSSYSVDNNEYNNQPDPAFNVKCNSLFEAGLTAAGPVQVGDLPEGVIDELTEPALEVFGNTWIRDGNLKIHSDIRHFDNERTLMRFEHDKISFIAGDARILTLTEKLSTDGNDLVEIGDPDQPADLKVYRQGEELSIFHDSTDGHVDFAGGVKIDSGVTILGASANDDVGIFGYNAASEVLGQSVDIQGSARVTQTLSAKNIICDFLTVQDNSFGNVGSGFGSGVLSPVSGVAAKNETVQEWTDTGNSQTIPGTPVGINIDLQYDEQGDIQKMYSFTFKAREADAGLGVEVGDTQTETYRLAARWDGGYTIAQVHDAEDGILYTSDQQFVTVSSVVLSATTVPTTERIVKVIAQAKVDCDFWIHNVLSQDEPLELNTVTTSDFRVAGNLTVDGNQIHDGDSTVTGDLHVQGDIRVDGNAYLSAGASGVLNVGDQNTDTVNILADVDSNLLPDVVQRLNNYNFILNSPGGASTPSTISGWTVTDGALKASALAGNKVTPNTPTVNTVSIEQGFHFESGFSYDVDVDVLQERAAIQIILDQPVQWSDGTTGTTGLGKFVTFHVHSTPPTNVTVKLSDETIINSAGLYKRHHIGSEDKQWDAMYVKDVNISEQVEIGGDVVMNSNLHVIGDIRVDGNAYLSAGASGLITVGDTDTDVVVFKADIKSDIVPDDNMSYDLGTIDKHWNNIYTHNLSAHGDVNVNVDLNVGADTTLTGVLSVKDNTTIDGNTTLNGTLDVDDAVTINDTLDVELDTTLHSDLVVSGDTTIGGNTVLSGTLDVDDATTINDTLDVELKTTLHSDLVVSGAGTIGGNTVLSGTLDVDDATTINDTLDVELKTTLHSDLVVSGTSTIGGNVVLSGTLDVDDAVTINDTLDVELDTTLHSDLVVSGDTTIGGNTILSGTLDVDDATTINDTLDVELDTTLHSDLIVSGATTVGGNTILSGTLDVDDATTINDTLDVSGDGTFESNLVVSGASTIGGNTVLSGTLDVDDAVTINDTLDVELDTTLHSDLTVSGTGTIGGNVVLSGTLDVDDAVTINDTLDVELDTTLHSDLVVSGTGTIGGNTVLSGTLDVDDVVTINDTLDVELDTTLHSDLIVSGDTTIGGNMVLSGTLDVDDAVTINDMLNVSGDGTFARDVWIKGDLRVDGNAYLSAGASGTINVGDTNTDNVVFHADVNSSIIPNVDARFGLGTKTQKWSILNVDDIDSTGSLTVSGVVTVGGNTVLSGTLDVDDAVTINDTLDVELDTTLHSDLVVSGDTTVGGNTVLSGTLDVDDAVTINDTLDVELDTTLHSDLVVSGTGTIGGNVVLSGTLDVDDAVTINDTLDVELDTTLKSDLVVSGDTTIGGNTMLSGTLDVDDATTINDTLDVELDTTLKSDLVVSGASTIGGNTVLSGTLDVDDAVTINDMLNVSGSSTFESDVWIKGDLRVDGNAYLSAGASGTINVGDTDSDVVIFHADVDSDITPDDDVTYDLGSSTQQWRELFVQDVSATGDVYWSGGGSLSSNSVYSYVNTNSGTNGWAHLKPETGFGPTKLVLDPDQVPRLAITNVYTVSNPENVTTQQSKVLRGDFVMVVAQQDNLIAVTDNPSGVYDWDTGNYAGYTRLFAPENMVRVINGMQGQSITLDPDDMDDVDTDHKFVTQTQKDNWDSTYVSVSSLSAYWGEVDQGTTDTLSRTMAHAGVQKRFLTMQSNNPAKDSDWNDVDWEHSFITPYAAKVIKVMLRGRNTAGKQITIGVHTNTGKQPSDGKDYECFSQVPLEEKTINMTDDFASASLEFSSNTVIGEGRTLGISVQADGDIGPCSVTIFLEYPKYIFTEDARPIGGTQGNKAGEEDTEEETYPDFNITYTGLQATLLNLENIPTGTIAYAIDTNNILIYQQTNTGNQWIIFASD